MNEQNVSTDAGSTQTSMDVDALYDSIQNPAPTERQQSEAPQENQVQKTQSPQEFEINWNGKKIKAPIEKVSQWASQGYDYGQKMAEFNKQQQEFQSKSKQIQDIETKYAEIDAYVRDNPDWWNHVTQSWEQKNQTLQQNPQQGNVRDLAKLYAEEAIKPIKEQLQQREQQELYAKQDAELDTQIKSVQEKYPDLDFNTVGEDGKTLMYKVLEFGAQNGISKFDIAFKAFYHDDLVKRESAKAKESVNKQIQRNTKLGLLGKSPTPTKGLSEARDIKNKSYNDLTREALEELGI